MLQNTLSACFLMSKVDVLIHHSDECVGQDKLDMEICSLHPR